MITILRNGDRERVSFSDTEIDAELAPDPRTMSDSLYGMHTDSGFQRVVNGNAISGPHRRVRKDTARRSLITLVLLAVCALAYRACTRGG